MIHTKRIPIDSSFLLSLFWNKKAASRWRAHSLIQTNNDLHSLIRRRRRGTFKTSEWNKQKKKKKIKLSIRLEKKSCELNNSEDWSAIVFFLWHGHILQCMYARAPPIDLHVWLFLSLLCPSVCLIIRQKESAAISAAPWYREREPELLLLLPLLEKTPKPPEATLFLSLLLSFCPFLNESTARKTHRSKMVVVFNKK